MVIVRSAEFVKVAFAVLELFAGFGSGVTDAIFAVFVIVEPLVPEATFATSVNPAVAPEASEAMLHEIVAPGMQVKVDPEVCVRELNVVPVGRMSVQVTVVALDGPLFPTLIV